jgi:hypothetical protein
MTGRNLIIRQKPEADPMWLITSLYCYNASDLNAMSQKFENLLVYVSDFLMMMLKSPEGIPLGLIPILQAHKEAALEKERRARNRRTSQSEK